MASVFSAMEVSAWRSNPSGIQGRTVPALAALLRLMLGPKDTAGLRQALVSDAFSSITYDGEKPKALLDEDKVIGALKLNIAPDKVRITPIGEVFAK